ncbi:DNA excision repair protein ERCC-6 [Diachasma alloeum]|uniref:DNA excision repair protein ERCC-6 n=1 Tax=Diachasma alloeum TaxID=454923 RepID=UPI0007383155|nr:DNA excision repair protein ERCC-6 [Diachasma alloeum]
MAEESFAGLSQVLEIRTEQDVHQELSKKLDGLSQQEALDPEDEGKNIQRQVELGEITPFEADAKKKYALCSSADTTGTFNATTGLLDLEKYLKRQAEVAAKSKQQNPKKLVKSKNFLSKKPRLSRNKAQPAESPGEITEKLKKSQKITEKGKKKSLELENGETSGRCCKKALVVKAQSSENPIDNWLDSESGGSEYTPPSSDESDESSRPPRRKRKRNPSRKSLDDGDEEHYHSRLSKLPRTAVNPPVSSLRTISNLFKLPKSLWKRLYPFQRVSVHWLWELHTRNLGGLLGDEMGLGKTVQVIAFLAALDCSELLSDGGRFRGLGPSLIVCPATLLEQWVEHFHSWYPALRVASLHQSGSYHGTQTSADLLESLKTSGGGVLLTSYTGVLRNSDLLIPFRWHYVILDEGHKIRNPAAKITKLVKRLSTPHRLILTGSPMQNSLKELWSLFDFILPGKLGTLDAFIEHCATPITRGGYANASTLQEATALQVATMLKEAITPYMLRRTKSDVQHHVTLPDKNEQVLFCSLTQEQTDLYKNYLTSDKVKTILHERSMTDGRGRARMLMAVTDLRKICNHPDLFTYTTPECSVPFYYYDQEEPDIDENVLLEEFGHWRKSGKMTVVRSLLRIWKNQGHRVLIFSQGRQMMAILEGLLQKEEYKYLRLDGTTAISERQKSIKLFNLDDSYFVFVSTTRVGGLGVNLTGANRVIIYDPDWNPATDAQAKERAWRIGQEKNVTIYRLISAGTIEEKMYHRQIFKLLLSNKVLDDPRQRRLFQTSDLSELFHLNEPIDGGTSTESDRLFGNSIITRKKLMSAMFEGERVDLLIGRRLAKSGASERSEQASIHHQNADNDDNYVLSKLFSKSRLLNSAMAHDTVLASARLEGHMATPVQRLARESAQESMEGIRKSRKWCWKPNF